MKAAFTKALVAASFCLAGVLAFYLIFGIRSLSSLILLMVPILVVAIVVLLRSLGPGAQGVERRDRGR